MPTVLQQEIRYGLHRHAKTPRRSHRRPVNIQRVVDDLAAASVQSLTDDTISDIAEKYPSGSMERRILLDLPTAARSLVITADMSKEAGWFDPVIVGGAPFAGADVSNRRKPWDLTGVSQRWLRDLVWEHLRDESLKPKGKRAVKGTIYRRVAAMFLVSYALRQIRSDHGNDPPALSEKDALRLKELWDLWFREQTVLPAYMDRPSRQPMVFNERSRHTYMSSCRIVLRNARERRRTPASLDMFILNLPEYPRAPSSPRPRPLTYGDFKLLIDQDNIELLEGADRDDVGFADIWLTQAFQGGRISETIQLRLGCVGLVGNAQPYIWRDISKVNVIDYGMPCYLPIYERLLTRQHKTRSKLRRRYAAELANLDERGRAALEARWDRTMPLFPAAIQNPDLVLETSQCGFRDTWTAWFESLGLKGITTHQTRATLATSLLNNGAPAALVRQLLGHFSSESLAHYATYNNESMTRHLQQVWAAGPGMNKPGTILLRPELVNAENTAAGAARIDLSVVPVEHGLCRYGPVVGGTNCPFEKNCTNGPLGPCEHFILAGADLAYWERKRDAAYHFAEGAPTQAARNYILSQWDPWEPVLTALREALDELGLLEEAENLDLRTPLHDYFDPLFATGWRLTQLHTTTPADNEELNL
ncbi:site-specific integrase [Mycobacterium aquaticum]|uniref:site-specific integrase n=1 Tax=Mycobacterium aquaticum TaxID=1927124 RepID=UPI001FE5E9E7|nr:site-specific integrase [Mycobacterium aquaticum]